MFSSTKQKIMTYLVFTLYMILLTWLILFKFSTNIGDMDYIRGLNLIPFKGSMIINGRISYNEIIYNVLVFIPLGVYISALNPKWSFGKKIIPALLLSVIYEVLQFIFAIGTSDITDVIGNTLGGVIGIALLRIFQKKFQKQFLNIINIIGLIIEFLVIAMLCLLLVANA